MKEQKQMKETEGGTKGFDAVVPSTWLDCPSQVASPPLRVSDLDSLTADVTVSRVLAFPNLERDRDEDDRSRLRPLLGSKTRLLSPTSVCSVPEDAVSNRDAGDTARTGEARGRN